MRLSYAYRLLSGAVVAVVDAGADLRRGRRVWVRAGRAYVQVRGPAAVEEYAVLAKRVTMAVSAVDGVEWCAVNGALGRAVVAFDEARVTIDDLVSAVECAETGDNTDGGAVAFPGDGAPTLGAVLALAGDVVGATAAVAGRIGRAARLPAELMALPAVLDLVPQLRRRRVATVGGQVIGAWTTAGLAAASGSPLSLVVDAGLRTLQVAETVAARNAWRRRAASLAATAETAAADPLTGVSGRPTDGPVERYARRAGTITLASAAALLFTGPLRAARAVTIGTPRAAIAARESFAAALGRLLADRGAVVRDPTALRRLDRIDATVIHATAIHAAALTTGTSNADPSGAAPAAGGSDETGLVALTDGLIAAARSVGRVVIVAADTIADGGDLDVVGVETAPAGTDLATAVAALRAEGHGVALVTGIDDEALAAADCSIGICADGARPPWGAHLLCGPGSDPSWLLLTAVPAARTVSARGVRLAALGSAAGALLGFLSPAGDAGRGGQLPVNLAALAGIAAGLWSVRQLARRRPPPHRDPTPWHAIPAADVLDRLGTGLSGLAPDEVARRRRLDDNGTAENGAAENGAAEGGAVGGGERGDTDEAVRRQGLLDAVVTELDTPLTAPLVIGSGASAATGSLVDAALVLAVLGGNALLGGVQRLAANRALRGLVTASTPGVRVVRGGVERLVPADSLVRGDVLRLEAGDVVPADCRVVEASAVEADESALTGESLPVGKASDPVGAAAVADRASMLYSGTTIAAGTATAAVVATGASTEAGRAAHTASGDAPVTGVAARLGRLAASTVPVAAGATAAMLLAGAARGRLAASVNGAVALAVAAVPEGLPFVATAAQLAAARRLSRRNVLVRNLTAMEALGRVGVVCFDKTGTLTMGALTVRWVSDGVTGEPTAALTEGRRAVLAAALRASPSNDGGPPPHATDRAVLDAGTHAGVSTCDGVRGWEPVRELPFESGRDFHAVLGATPDGQRISVKGAPETVLPRCVTWRRGDATGRLTAADRRGIDAEVDRLARTGQRVLAVAERVASAHRRLGDDRVDRLELVGLLGLSDPVRPTAAEAIATLRRAGIGAAMLTGDHPSTAEAIGAELGLLNGHRPLTGPELAALTDAEIDELVASTAVFARVSPADKVTIVAALQRTGRTVAVTGDGANDAPAIRLAEVGIALGNRGTTAARQAADIIVTDDRIETIVDAVTEGRALWTSVRDAIALLLGGNLGEIAFTAGASVLTARPPLGARQLLLVNLFTDLLPALTLAARRPRHADPDQLLRQGPDTALGAGLRRDVAIRAGATAGAAAGGWVVARLTGTRGRATTVALVSLVGAQLAQTLAASRGDPLVLAATAASAAVLAATVQTPGVSHFFGCRPLGPLAWSIALGATASGAIIAAAADRVLPGGALSRPAPAAHTLA